MSTVVREPSTYGRLLIETITSPDPSRRDRPVLALLEGASTAEVIAACEDLVAFRQESDNLYERVRALMFLQTIHRYVLQESPDLPGTGLVSFEGFTDLMERRFEQAIAAFRSEIGDGRPDGAIAAPGRVRGRGAAHQTLADQVRSVRSCRATAGCSASARRRASDLDSSAARRAATAARGCS